MNVYFQRHDIHNVTMFHYINGTFNFEESYFCFEWWKSFGFLLPRHSVETIAAVDVLVGNEKTEDRSVGFGQFRSVSD